MKAKTIVTLLAIGASLVIPQTASAAAWHVNGSEVPNKNLLEKAAVKKAITLNVAGGIEFECKSTEVKFKNAKIIASNAMTIEHMTLGECKAVSGPCELTNPTIETKELTGTATLGESPVDSLVLSEVEKKLVAEVKFEGSKCALLGTQVVKGKITLSMPKGQEELVGQNMTPKMVTGELTVGGFSTILGGEFTVETVSTEKWSFR